MVWSADAPSAAGNARIEVPTDLWPTWRGRANRLRWKIVVKGRVAGLPDVDDSYPVTVVPATVRDNGSVIVAGPAVGDPPQGITLTTRPGNPGEAIAAQIRWYLVKAPGTFTLRFVWKATGKGGTEKGTIHGLSFPGKAEDGIAVAFVLPSYPPRHHGALVSVVYRLELLADARVIFSVDV